MKVILMQFLSFGLMLAPFAQCVDPTPTAAAASPPAPTLKPLDCGSFRAACTAAVANKTDIDVSCLNYGTNNQIAAICYSPLAATWIPNENLDLDPAYKATLPAPLEGATETGFGCSEFGTACSKAAKGGSMYVCADLKKKAVGVCVDGGVVVESLPGFTKVEKIVTPTKDPKAAAVTPMSGNSGAIAGKDGLGWSGVVLVVVGTLMALFV
ncbi:hypothetical protein HDV05_006706 [Chytridiales sp. JEL 0842]|nr:hypothetical protein HDV05_006706 [Chytridiales sp. JEL 0842]